MSRGYGSGDLVPSAIRAPFENAGLATQLASAVGWIEGTINLMADERTFVSAAPVIDVLTQVVYDPDDRVFVVWRAEHPTDFWTQARKDQYLKYLRHHAAAAGGALNQTRLMIYDDAPGHDLARGPNILPPDHIFFSLLPLHAPGSFLSSPLTTLDAYPRVAGLRFGFTISSKHRYAIISVPFADDLRPEDLSPSRLDAFLDTHGAYGGNDGPLRVVVTVNREFVDALLDETIKLSNDPSLYAR